MAMATPPWPRLCAQFLLCLAVVVTQPTTAFCPASNHIPLRPFTVRQRHLHHQTIRLQESTSADDVEMILLSSSLSASSWTVPLLVITALGLGVAAQGWINQQLDGDQGLGAFLKDGRGYSNSGFRPVTDDDRAGSGQDPLPWLSLPRLDFVQVAGQEETTEDVLLAQLEELRVEMNQQLAQGNVAEATAIRRKLESVMRENGIEFQTD